MAKILDIESSSRHKGSALLLPYEILMSDPYGRRNGNPSYSGGARQMRGAHGHPAHEEQYEGAGEVVQDDRPSGNAMRDAWLAERSEGQLRRLSALAASEGLKLQPATILRPILLPQQADGLVTSQQVTLSFYFPFFAYIRKITSTVRQLSFIQNQEPDDAIIGTLDPRQYIDGKITRANGEQIMSTPVSMDQWSGDGGLEYIFDLIPFATLGETISIVCDVNDRIQAIDRLQVTLHCMRFPVEGV